MAISINFINISTNIFGQTN